MSTQPGWNQDAYDDHLNGEEQEMPCECSRCPNCDGAGMEYWYLSDEFNSERYATCGLCEGSGIIVDDCPLHHQERSNAK
jgi:DnaJ-class molecular chaperone